MYFYINFMGDEGKNLENKYIDTNITKYIFVTYP